MAKQVVNLKTLQGEPTDGTGQVCIHLFVPDEAGPFVEPHALHPVFKDGQMVKQQVCAKPTRGRLACDRKRVVAPVRHRDGSVTVTLRTDDPRGVTCRRCKASDEYLNSMKE